MLPWPGVHGGRRQPRLLRLQRHAGVAVRQLVQRRPRDLLVPRGDRPHQAGRDHLAAGAAAGAAVAAAAAADDRLQAGRGPQVQPERGVRRRPPPEAEGPAEPEARAVLPPLAVHDPRRPGGHGRVLRAHRHLRPLEPRGAPVRLGVPEVLRRRLPAVRPPRRLTFHHRPHHLLPPSSSSPLPPPPTLTPSSGTSTGIPPSTRTTRRSTRRPRSATGGRPKTSSTRTASSTTRRASTRR